jgi:hypothetical protein
MQREFFRIFSGYHDPIPTAGRSIDQIATIPRTRRPVVIADRRRLARDTYRTRDFLVPDDYSGLFFSRLAIVNLLLSQLT